jgi:hypothetical protein
MFSTVIGSQNVFEADFHQAEASIGLNLIKILLILKENFGRHELLADAGV